MTEVKRSEMWQRLRAARTKADLTQSQVAKEFGLSRPAITLWENATPGNRSMPSADQIKRLAELYKVSADWLLDDTANPDDVWLAPAQRVAPSPAAAKVAVANAATAQAGTAFFSAVRWAVQSRNPTYASNFDVQLSAGHGDLDVVAPYARAGTIVLPAALDDAPGKVIAREAPKLLWAERAGGRKARLHLMLWAPAGAEVPAEVIDATRERFNITVSVFSSVDGAADFILST